MALSTPLLLFLLHISFLHIHGKDGVIHRIQGSFPIMVFRFSSVYITVHHTFFDIPEILYISMKYMNVDRNKWLSPIHKATVCLYLLHVI